MTKKRIPGFLFGCLTTLTALALGTTVLAAAGRVEYNRAGIALFGKDRVVVGESYTAPNGQKVPAVITYIDEAENTTNYLSVRQISELLGVKVQWDSQKNRVNIGGDPASYVTVGNKGDDIPPNPTKPVLGTVRGPFTEIDPSEVADKTLTGVMQSNTNVQTTCGFSTLDTIYPEDGSYVVLTVTNNGSDPQTVTAARALTLGGFEMFTSVDIGAGQTLTRAFRIADGASELESRLSCGVYATDAKGSSDLTISLKQYQ